MRDETRKDSPSPSPVERAFDIASSSVISASFLIIGLVAAQVVCLPILLLLRVSAMLFFPFNSRRDDVDSSIRPYSPPTDDVDACTFTNAFCSISWDLHPTLAQAVDSTQWKAREAIYCDTVD